MVFIVMVIIVFLRHEKPIARLAVIVLHDVQHVPFLADHPLVECRQYEPHDEQHSEDGDGDVDWDEGVVRLRDGEDACVEDCVSHQQVVGEDDDVDAVLAKGGVKIDQGLKESSFPIHPELPDREVFYQLPKREVRTTDRRKRKEKRKTLTKKKSDCVSVNHSIKMFHCATRILLPFTTPTTAITNQQLLTWHFWGF